MDVREGIRVERRNESERPRLRASENMSSGTVQRSPGAVSYMVRDPTFSSGSRPGVQGRIRPSQHSTLGGTNYGTEGWAQQS